MASNNLMDSAKQFVEGMFKGPQQDTPSSKNRMNPEDNDDPIEIIDGEKYYKRALENQKAFHPIWYRNVAAYAGQQWLDWNSQTNWFQETSAPSWRVRMTHNLILPKIRAAIAQELDSNPKFYAMPANNMPESKGAARIASRILEAKYYEDDFHNMFERHRLWARMTGSSWIFALKDKTGGKTWSDNVMDENGAPVIDPATGQPKMQEYATGDICYSVDNSFEVLLDPDGQEDFNLHRKIMRVKIMSVDQIKDNWNVEVQPEQVTLDIMYQVRIMSLVDASGRYRTSTAEGQMLKNMALVKHYIELPSKQYPNGREWIYSNGKVLEASHDVDYWYLGKRALPCGKSDDIKIPGRCHGGSGIEQIVPIQIQINKMSSQVIENANLMTRPKYLAPVGSLQEDQVTDQPAEVVEYVPGPNGQKPEPMTPPEMPQYFFQKYTELKQLMEDIYGMHDVSTGRLPRRATSGVAIDALQSADSGPISFSMRSCGASLSRVFSISIKLMQDMYTEQRIARLVGKDHEVEVIEFKGADLKGCDFVRVDFGSHMTRGQRINLAMQMAESKLITPEKALEIMELGNVDSIYDQDSFQKNYAQQENMGLAKGVMQMVGPLEPHDVHIKTHLDYINGAGSQLPHEIAAIFKMHVDEHRQAAMAAMAPSGPLAPGVAGGAPPALPGPEPMPGNMPGIPGGGAQ